MVLIHPSIHPSIHLTDLAHQTPHQVVSLETKILAAEAELGKGGIDAARREQLETELVSNRGESKP
jgi:hypothetical protein